MKRVGIRNQLRMRGAWRRALCGVGATALAAALSLPAQAQVQTISFDIESQPLSAALLALGRQADLSILAPTSLTNGKTAPQVRGEYSVSAALDQLLAGSGLRYEFVRQNAVRIVVADQASPTQPPSPISSEDEIRDRVVVTGTTIAGIPPTGSPVDVYTADDIVRTGATTTEQFLAKLPQNLGTQSQFAAGSMVGQPNFDSVTSVDLRGLGVGTTLTLLNGHRLALSSSGRSVDLSLIPASAIERVEVLTDGASAIYGSDAIGGVINFVLKDDFEGAETRLSYGGVTSGGLRQGGASQTLGGKWHDGHGLIAYNFHSASALKTTDRDYAAAAGPGNLTPIDSRHSVFATLSQDVGDRLTLDVDLGGNWRKVKNRYSNISSLSPAAHTLSRYRSETDQAFGTIALSYAWSNDLTAHLSASYSEIDTDSRFELVRVNLTPQITTASDLGSRHSLFDVLAKLEGSLFEVPGGRVRFSLGGGFLDEQFKGVSPISNRQSAGSLGRRSPYLFGELYAPLVRPEQGVPLVRSLSISLSARYTDYQDNSDPALARDFGDSTDPKVGLSWSPIESVGLRATYSTSFRAPSLTQLDMTGGLHTLLALDVGGTPSILLNLAGYPVADLGPETAESFTLGFDYKPPSMPDFRLSGTYYNIDYTNRIGTAPTGGLNPLAAPLLLPDLIYRPPSVQALQQALSETRLAVNTTGINVSDPVAGAATLFARDDVWMLDTRQRNLAVSKQDGIDLTIAYALKPAWGDVQIGANVSHIFNYDQQGSSASAVLTAVDIPGMPPNWRGRAFVGTSIGDFSGVLNLNYTDSYSNPAAPAGLQRVDSWTTADLSLTYQSSDGGSTRVGPRINLSIQNLFDQEPPFLRTGSGSNITSPVGFDPANANPLGRMVVIGVTQSW